MTPDTPAQPVTVQQAAEALGISEGAILKRISRGILPASKGDDGRWRVYLSDTTDTPQTGQPDTTPDTPDNTPTRTRPDKHAVLSGRLAALEADNAALRAEVDAAREEGRRWQEDAHAWREQAQAALRIADQQQQLSAMLANTKALPAAPGDEPQEPDRAPWWVRIWGTLTRRL
jgi:hypothetical protein